MGTYGIHTQLRQQQSRREETGVFQLAKAPLSLHQSQEDMGEVIA